MEAPDAAQSKHDDSSGNRLMNPIPSQVLELPLRDVTAVVHALPVDTDLRHIARPLIVEHGASHGTHVL